MEAFLRVAHEEHHRHLVQEPARVGVALRAEILTDVKDDAVAARQKAGPFQERCIRSPLGVGGQ